jgi:hypothetical protein
MSILAEIKDKKDLTALIDSGLYLNLINIVLAKELEI